jgi:hypothetical protein
MGTFNRPTFSPEMASKNPIIRSMDPENGMFHSLGRSPGFSDLPSVFISEV